jgi:hypothetical protein
VNSHDHDGVSGFVARNWPYLFFGYVLATVGPRQRRIMLLTLAATIGLLMSLDTRNDEFARTHYSPTALTFLLIPLLVFLVARWPGAARADVEDTWRSRDAAARQALSRQQAAEERLAEAIATQLQSPAGARLPEQPPFQSAARGRAQDVPRPDDEPPIVAEVPRLSLAAPGKAVYRQWELADGTPVRDMRAVATESREGVPT